MTLLVVCIIGFMQIRKYHNVAEEVSAIVDLIVCELFATKTTTYTIVYAIIETISRTLCMRSKIIFKVAVCMMIVLLPLVMFSMP